MHKENGSMKGRANKKFVPVQLNHGITTH